MDVGWLGRWVTVWIAPVSPQHMHLFIQPFIPLTQAFTEHLLGTRYRAECFIHMNGLNSNHSSVMWTLLLLFSQIRKLRL